jgi:probable phosphoglycerate mutase
VIDHCLLVAALGRVLTIQLNQVGLNLDVELVYGAGCVHDLVRGRSDHARAGGAVLEALGFARTARVVASHMDYRFCETINESGLVFLADKLVDGDRIVSLDERFERARRRFRNDPDILDNVLKRFESAGAIKARVEGLLGSPVEAIIRRLERNMRASLHSRQRTVYLARHGAVEKNGGGKMFIGQTDVDLSDEGRRQAEELSLELRSTTLSALFCSDLKRSADTAKIIGKTLNLEPQPIPELREIALGQWDGLSFAEVSNRFLEEFKKRGQDIVHYRPPEGESFLDCAMRVLPALYRILHSTRGNILIVGHAGVNRIILSQAMGRDLKDLMGIGQEYCALSRIGYDGHLLSLYGECSRDT